MNATPSIPPAHAKEPEAEEIGALRQFGRDENGAVFIEFLIILYPFMFILFGVLQAGLVCMASYYTNYAGFMALRTASVKWELMEVGMMSYDELRADCEKAAAAALAPMEPFFFRNPTDFAAANEVESRILFFPQGDGGNTQLSKEVFGSLFYAYPCIIPFAGGVFAVFDSDPDIDGAPDRVMQNFISEVNALPNRYPMLTINSHDDLTPTANDPPFPHNMLIQRRWRYLPPAAFNP